MKLTYNPMPEKILSSMREKQNEMKEELFNGKFPSMAKLVYEVAWRDACLYCLQEIKDAADVSQHEPKAEWREPAQAYLERVYEEIMKDNALSPFVNYQEGA